MRGYLKLSWLLGGLVQLMPLLLHAQAITIERGPPVPDPLPAPMRVVPPPIGAPPFAAPPLPGSAPARMPRPGAPAQPLPDLSQAPEEMNPIENILNFWFGALPGPDFFPEYKMPIWFANTPEIDRQMRDNFGQEVMNAQRGEYNNWRSTPRGRLALIILLDQFPRHIYRGQPQEFALDTMARALVIEGIQKGDDKRLYPIERAFFYLPLEHAEDLEIQNLSVAVYQQLLADSPEPLKLQMQDFLQAAITHQQQIAHFGRFPYRNAILGRESTPEENVFLMQWRKR